MGSDRGGKGVAGRQLSALSDEISAGSQAHYWVGLICTNNRRMERSLLHLTRGIQSSSRYHKVKGDKASRAPLANFSFFLEWKKVAAGPADR